MTDKEYSRYPKDFLKDVFIELHLFDNPEKDEHGEYVDIQMKTDLFTFAYDRLSNVELRFLRPNEDYFKLKSIKKCDGTFQNNWFHKLYREKMVQVDDDMLECEQWVIDINGQREVEYKLEFFQSKLDKFYTVIYPPTIMKFIYYYIKNY